MKIAIISLGCPKNQVDADVFCHALIKDGHTTVADPAEADIIIINTCGFIESAKTEAIENILMACQYKQENPDLKVIVTGCLGGKNTEEGNFVALRFPKLLGVTGPEQTEEVLRLVHDNLPRPHEPFGDLVPAGGVLLTPKHYAYLKIAEGCNHHCTFLSLIHI